MGLYSYRYPHEHDAKDFATLVVGKPVKIGLNLTQISNSAIANKVSIQAISSGTVNVSFKVGNIATLPFDSTTDMRGWKTPSDLWLPCTSLTGFTVTEGVNYHQEGEWKDPFRFLKIELNATKIGSTVQPTPQPQPEETDPYWDEFTTVDPNTGLTVIKRKITGKPELLPGDIYTASPTPYSPPDYQIDSAGSGIVAFVMVVTFL